MRRVEGDAAFEGRGGGGAELQRATQILGQDSVARRAVWREFDFEQVARVEFRGAEHGHLQHEAALVSAGGDERRERRLAGVARDHGDARGAAERGADRGRDDDTAEDADFADARAKGGHGFQVSEAGQISG